MKKLVSYILIFAFIILSSCSSADENVKVNTFHGFSPENLKKQKIVFLPYILESPDLKSTYRKAFMRAKDRYIKEWKISYPHQSESMLDAYRIFSAFVKLKKINPLTHAKKFAKIGKKVKYRYLVILKFKKPSHVKLKKMIRKTVWVYDKENDMRFPQTSNVYINIDMWYQKGEVYIIDSKKRECVYHLSKETKSGYRRESSRSFLPSTFRELIKSGSDKSIPTHLNAVFLFYKGLFQSWN